MRYLQTALACLFMCVAGGLLGQFILWQFSSEVFFISFRIAISLILSIALIEWIEEEK